MPLWVRGNDDDSDDGVYDGDGDGDDDDDDVKGSREKRAKQCCRVVTAITCLVLVVFVWLFVFGLVVSHREGEEGKREGE